MKSRHGRRDFTKLFRLLYVDDVQEVVMLVAGEAATVIGIGDVAELGADGCEGLFQVFLLSFRCG